MQISVDLGFPSLVLAILSVVFCIVLKVKWQRHVFRKAEIQRLLALVSEESARAELESSFSYYSSLQFDTSTSSSFNPSSLAHSPVMRNGYQCAVCYSPTTTRCARCKSVRYCSGKCQIIHWRLGHKENCRQLTVPNIARVGEKLDKKATRSVREEVFRERCDNMSQDGLNRNHLMPSSSIPSVKKETEVKDCLSFKESPNSVSLSSDSFSGFSTSPTSVGSSDDVSIGESDTLNDSEFMDFASACDESEVAEFASNSIEACPTNIVSHDFNPDMRVHGDNEEGFQPSSTKCANLVERVSNHDENDPSGDTMRINGASKVFNSNDTHEKIVGKRNETGIWRKSNESVVDSVNNSAVNTRIERDSSFMRQPISSLDKAKERKQKDSESVTNNSRIAGGNGIGNEVNSSGPSDINSKKVEVSFDNSCLSDYSRDFLNLQKPIAKFTDTFTSNYPLFSDLGNDSHSASASLTGVSCNTSSRGEETSFYEESTKQDSLKHPLPNSVHPTPSSYINGLKSSVLKAVDNIRAPKSGSLNNMRHFSYDQFVKLYVSTKPDMKPFGLVNCGNSCYANSVLQCLAFTPPLTAYFVQGLHSRTCCSDGWCFTCEFEGLMMKAKEGKSPLSPIGIISHLPKIGRHLSHGREEDAHEFLRFAIDTMQSGCLKEAGASSFPYLGRPATVVGLTFGGYLHSKIRCLKCQYKSEREERMMDLAVEIGGDIETLEDALRRFTRSEILDGDNKYQCTRCKSKEMAKKKLTILEAPNVLTIALKRFQAGKFGKLNKSVRYPETLNMSPYMTGAGDKSPVYRLYAVIVHIDVMNAAFSGHYVCYVKNSQNRWFKVDDSSVTAIELEKVLSKEAYMLLYARCSPRAPRDAPPSRESASASAYESFYLKFHRLQKIVEEDSSSDSFSFSSSNSDEGSCSTDSTKDSVCADELSDHSFRKTIFDTDTSPSDPVSVASSSADAVKPALLLKRLARQRPL